MRRLFLVLGSTLALLVVGVPILLLLAVQTGPGKAVLSSLVSRLASTPDQSIEIGRIEGFVPANMRIEKIALSDKEGVWLEVEEAALDWRPLALLRRRIAVNALTAQTVMVHRTPAASPTAEAEPLQWPPEVTLPAAIDLNRLAVERLVYRPAEVEAAVDGSAQIGTDDLPWQVQLAVTRAGGDVGLDVDLAMGQVAPYPVSLSAVLSEPSDGVLADILGLPGMPAISAQLSGDGPIDQWQATGRAKAEGLIDLALNITTSPAQADGRIDLSVGARGTISPGINDQVGPLLATWNSADVSANVGLDGSIDTAALSLEASALQLSAEFDANRDAGALVAFVSAEPHPAWQPLVPDLAWSSAGVELVAADVPAAPRAKISFSVDEVGVGAEEAIALDNLSASLAFNSVGPVTDPDTTVGFDAEVMTEGARFPNPVLADLIGDVPYASTEGELRLDGSVTLARLTVETAAAVLEGQVNLSQWGRMGKAGFELVMEDFSALGLEGVDGALNQDVVIDIDNGAIAIETALAVDRFTSGDGRVDALVGQQPEALASLSIKGSDVTINDLMISGQRVSFDGDGALSQGFLAAGGALTLDDLSALDPQVTGAARADISVTGALEAPALAVRLTGSEVAAAGRVIANPVINIDATLEAVSTSLSADIDGVPLAGQAQGRITDGDRWTVEPFLLDLGGVRLAGAASGVGPLADGTLTLTGETLSPLSPLVGAPLSGSLDGQVGLAAQEGRQTVSSALAVQGIQHEAASLERLSVELAIQDAVALQGITGRVEADGLTSGALEGASLAVDLDGGLDAFRVIPQVTALVAGETLSAQGDATIGTQEETIGIDLADLRLDWADIPLRLRQPAALTIAPGGIEISGLDIALDDGDVQLDGTLGDRHDLAVSLENIPVSLASSFIGQDIPSGRIDGVARLSGTRSAPDGRVDLRLTDLTLSSAVEPVQGDLSAVLSASALSVQTTLEAGPAVTLNGQADIALSPPEPAGLFPSAAPDSPLAGAANGTVDLSQLAALVPPAIDRLEGQLDLDIALDGTIGAPTVTGAATLANGIIEQRELGFLITDVSAQVDGAVDQVILQSLTGRFVDGGELTANAAVDLDQLPAIPVQAEMRLGRSRVLDGDLATVDMQGGITLTGVLAEAARLEGGFTIDDAEFRIPDSLPVSVVDLPVREKGASVETQGEPTEAALIATTLALDVGISAPSQVFVRGRGIDTELGGDLTITGTAAEPDIVGGFDLRRGRLSVLTQTLTVDRGRIGFDGAAPDDPTLDLVASTQVENTLAQVVVSGTASAPEFNFTSEPVLPEDEVASLILFGQSSAELSPFQALQLASAVAELTGRGPGFADRVRSGLGLDELTVTEGETGPSLRAGRYVSERVFVGVDRGLGSGGESSVSVEVELNDNITVESDVGARNSGQVGINFRLDY